MYKLLFALNGIFRRGGTEAVILNIFDNIDKNHFHIDFLVHGENAYHNEIHEKLINSGASIFYATPRHVSYKQNIIDIKHVLSNQKFDLVHSHMDAAGYFLMRLAKQLGIQTRISHSHNTSSQFSHSQIPMQDYTHKLILEYARYKLRALSTHFIACSNAAGKWLFGDKICNSKKYLLYHNGIDVDRFMFNDFIRNEVRAELGVTNSFVIGHVGRFSLQKNHVFLMKIFKEIYLQCNTAKLLLIGEGELLPNIQKEIYDLGLTNDSVIFAGIRQDVNRLYQAMDVMVFPSLFEGLPVVMVEAQASGLKIVASDRITQEAKLIPETEFMSLNTDPKIWASHILHYANGYVRRNTKKEIINTGYSAKDNIKILEKFYQKAIMDCKQ